jgi:hypothetical protein
MLAGVTNAGHLLASYHVAGNYATTFRDDFVSHTWTFAVQADFYLYCQSGATEQNAAPAYV